jgi:parallel beta-helix repeat protein
VTAYALPVPNEDFTLNNMESARVVVSYVIIVPLCVHIKADGSIDPQDAPISTVDNATYIFNGNTNYSIVVERDNIVVDGAGYTLQGTGSEKGIDLTGRSNVAVKNMKIEGFVNGIYLHGSSSNSIFGNNITNSEYGIRLSYSSNNRISGNNITANIHWGILLLESSNSNSISGNNIVNNGGGIAITYSSNYNSVSRNTIANNWDGAFLQYSSNNVVSSNKITGSHISLWTDTSSNNLLSKNKITKNDVGILLVGSNNVVSGNNITNNRDGIAAYTSSDKIYHNNFINNGHQVMLAIGGIWDNGYPSGGNYWSDHVCTGNPSDGSQPYVIDEDSVDRYPFQDPYGWVILGDLNDDGIVNIQDVVIAALAFGSSIGKPNIKGEPYNPDVDLNNDGKVNIIDLVMVAVNFGKKLPL